MNLIQNFNIFENPQLNLNLILNLTLIRKINLNSKKLNFHWMHHRIKLCPQSRQALFFTDIDFRIRYAISIFYVSNQYWQP